MYDADTAEQQVSLRIEGSRLLTPMIGSTETDLVQDAFVPEGQDVEGAMETAPVINWFDEPRTYGDQGGQDGQGNTTVPLEFALVLTLDSPAYVNTLQLESTDTMIVGGLEVEDSDGEIHRITTPRSTGTEELLTYHIQFPAVQARTLRLICIIPRPSLIPVQVNRYFDLVTAQNNVILSYRRVFEEQGEPYSYSSDDSGEHSQVRLTGKQEL